MKHKKHMRYLILAICALNFLCIGGCSYRTNNETESDLTSFHSNIESINKENELNQNEISTVDIYNKEEFKALCEELVLIDINESTIGKYVTKELVFGGSEELEGYTLYECGATEDFLEDLRVYQKTYNVYRIKDYRLDKDFPIEGDDVMRIYGIVEDVSKSYHTSNYNPTIKMYYAEYIRQYGEKPEEAKSEEEIVKEREKAAKELEYLDSLNSDYTGITKNIDNMNGLPLDEYMTYCDAMNLQDVVNSNQDFTGRHVKLHIQVTDHKIFKNDEGKTKRLGEWTEIESVQDDIWHCMLYNERVNEYVYPKAEIDILYFLNTESIDASALAKGDNLIVYGQFIKHNSESGEFEMLVRYYQKE